MTRITYIEETTSTNDLAKQATLDGAPHLSCFWANRQTKGRGREGRTWQTYPDVSIGASFVVRELASPFQLPLISAMAVQACVAEYTPCDIKWPNDILIQGEKVAGILIEAFPKAEEREAFYIVGIGINVNQPSSAMVGTSIQQAAGHPLEREQVLKNLQKKLESFLKKDWEDLYEDYKQKCVTLQQNVCWKKGVEGEITGFAKGLDKDGTLILETSSGQCHKVLSGDIIIQK